jgi:hypothetical protein
MVELAVAVDENVVSGKVDEVVAKPWYKTFSRSKITIY